ncbi:MAG: beta-lactamase family protein [Oscillospiraceae bacterium]|nr:beta-lactamase family protein [Oscillospiraceae bacterium]
MENLMGQGDFITATPESVGVPSSAITKFVRSLQDHSLCMHSILVFRRGKLIAEGYAPPFDAQRRHRMYSISKSFTALGIGLMAQEGKLGLDDRIVDHFPEYAPGPVHPFIAEATIRDMLTMRDCHDETSAGLADWFSTPPTHPPGTVFLYNTTCTNLMCAIIEKISGGTLMEYLYPRLLEPIGFTPGCMCIRGSWGYSWSGSGIICTPRDLAKVAMVCMNSGRWGEKQLINESFIREATSRQVDNAINGSDLEHQSGYGYQIWRTRHNGFAFLGMGTQLAVALPEQELLLVTTADTQGVANAGSIVLRSFWETVLASLSGGASAELGALPEDAEAQAEQCSLPEDADAQAELGAVMGGLKLTTSAGAHSSPTAGVISGKTYRLFDEDCGWRDVRFDFEGDGGRLVYTNRRGAKEIPFGFGHNKFFVFPETHYPGIELKKPAGRGYEAYASAGWVDDRTLSVMCYIADDYFGSLHINAVFDGNRITLFLKKTAEFFLDDYVGWSYGYC